MSLRGVYSTAFAHEICVTLKTGLSINNRMKYIRKPRFLISELRIIKLEYRQWQAMFSLFASIIGATVFTAFSAWLVWIMWKGGWALETAPERIEVLSKALLLSMGGSLVVLISMGFAINHRSLRITKDGLEASGGDTDTSDPFKGGDGGDGGDGDDPTATTVDTIVKTSVSVPTPPAATTDDPSADPAPDPLNNA